MLKMYRGTTLILLCLSMTMTLSYSELFSADKIRRYVKYLKFNALNINETGNDLWHGLFRDCNKRVTFSCIQKNAYTYLDNTFIERDNITVFDGLILTKNNITYDSCSKTENRNDVHENLVDVDANDCENKEAEDRKAQERKFGDESPLEEITNALRRKTVKFLSTRNYEIQLPQFFFEGATMKISPREIDENGALLRIDFGTDGVQEQGRIFKKIKKFIQNKLLTSFLALLLIIKLIKVKFLFIIPFLFGVGTAKKLFLKLLLFFIPAFAHIFKLCSSYYSQGTKFHHHHHQIAHHHHHVPVPVAVPSYFDHSHEPGLENFGDFSHPHIQYRKDLEELKEWGIEPNEPYEESSQIVNRVVPAPTSASGVVYSGPYGLPQYASNVKPIVSNYLDNSVAASAHNLAYSAYRRPVVQPTSAVLSINPGLMPSAKTPMKNPYAVFAPNIRPNHHQPQRFLTPVASAKSSSISISRQDTEDNYYGPIIARLEDIFGQLRFYEETCREMLVCSMYKNPAGYSPHSNLVSNELSRDPQELRRDITGSTSSQKFYRYLNAARHGQDGGDCLKTYPCHSNIE